MSNGFIIGPITLPDGTVVYMTTEDDQTITAGNGNFLLADFGQGGTLIAGNGDNDLFATRGYETITAGNGDNVVLAGVDSNITLGNATDQSVVAADKGSTITVGNGNNIIFMNGTTEQVTTGTGTDVVYALGTGSNNVTFGGGTNWAFLTDYNNVVDDGTGTDTDWMGLGASKIVPNAGGGTDFIYDFNNSDQIDLSKILAGLNVSLTEASLAPYVTVSEFHDATFPTLVDTLVTIVGQTGTAEISLNTYNAGSLSGSSQQNLQSMLNHNVFALAGTITV